MKTKKIQPASNVDTMESLYQEIELYNSPEETKKRQTKKVWAIVGDAVFGVLLIIFISLIALVNVTRAQGHVPFLFGYSLQYVQTGSMEPTIPQGSLIISKSIDENTTIIAKPITGDIITFYQDENKTALITHRAVDSMVVNGVTYYVTKGDANTDPDNFYDGNGVPRSSVISIYVARLF